MELDLLHIIKQIPLLPFTVLGVTHGNKSIVVREVLDKVRMKRHIGDDNIVDFCSTINEMDVLPIFWIEELHWEFNCVVTITVFCAVLCPKDEISLENHLHKNKVYSLNRI